MNVGERHELIATMHLIHLRDSNSQLTINNHTFNLNNVGLRGPYKPLPSGFNLNSLNGMTDQQLQSFAASLNITKSPSLAKADVLIGNVGYSLKSTFSAPPAIVNHTNRIGFSNVCNQVGTNISNLDPLIAQYWNLRTNGTIHEDIHNSDQLSPFSNHINLFRPILAYFLFDGTGSRVSSYKADYLISFSDPLNTQTWTLLDRNSAVDGLWPKLVFSIRSKKGMPKNYPNIPAQKLNCIQVWTKHFQGEYRGALHIRST